MAVVRNEAKKQQASEEAEQKSEEGLQLVTTPQRPLLRSALSGVQLAPPLQPRARRCELHALQEARQALPH